MNMGALTEATEQRTKDWSLSNTLDWNRYVVRKGDMQWHHEQEQPVKEPKVLEEN